MSKLGMNTERLFVILGYLTVGLTLAGVGLFLFGEEDEAVEVSLELSEPEQTAPELPAMNPEPVPFIRANGLASPAREIQLASPVSGRLHAAHPLMEPGGLIPAGETLWHIDATESEARVRSAQSRLEDIIAQSEIESGRARAAQREWDALGLSQDTVDDRDRAIALREPQAAEIQARIDLARSEVDLAQIELERCAIALDVDLTIIEETIEPGSWIEAGQPLVTGMEANAWHVTAWLTPGQADVVQNLGLDSIQADVRVLGSLRESLPSQVVRWLPSDTGRPQLQGLLLSARTPRPGVLWAGAHVDVTIRPSDKVGSALYLMPAPINRANTDAE